MFSTVKPPKKPTIFPAIPAIPQGARPADRDASGQGAGGPRRAGARRAPGAALLPRGAAAGAAGAAGLERLGAADAWGMDGGTWEMRQFYW